MRARSASLPQCEDGLQITHFETAIAPFFGRPRPLDQISIPRHAGITLSPVSSGTAMHIEPMSISIDEDLLADLRSRIRATR